MPEEPRLTRRQMREQGLLKALPSDAHTISPVQRLSETQEIHLDRPSRRDMRKLREAREASAEAGSAALNTGNDAHGLSGDAGSAAPQARVSVFERFEESKPTVNRLAAGTNTAPETDRAAQGGTGDLPAAGTHTQASAGAALVEPAQANNVSQSSEASLSDRLRLRFQQGGPVPAVDAAAPTTKVPAQVPEAATSSEDTAAQQVAEIRNRAEADEGKPVPQESKRKGPHWLVTVLFLLIAVLIGVLIGLVAKQLFFAGAADDAPLTILANAYGGGWHIG